MTMKTFKRLKLKKSQKSSCSSEVSGRFPHRLVRKPLRKLKPICLAVQENIVTCDYKLLCCQSSIN